MSTPGRVAVWGSGDTADNPTYSLAAQAVSAGQIIVVYLTCRSVTGSNFTSLVPSDNAAGGSNAYTQIYGVAPSSNSYASAYWCRCKNTETLTITETPSANATCSGQAFLGSGQAVVPVNVANSSKGTAASGTPFTPTAATSTAPGTLVIGSVHWIGTQTSTPLSAQVYTGGVTGQNNETPVSATNMHNNSTAISEAVQTAAGAVSFGGTLGGNVSYVCGLVAIQGVAVIGTQKQPAMGCLERGNTPPSGAATQYVHGYIIEAHWGAQSSQGDNAKNAMQPDPAPSGGWGTSIAGDGSAAGGTYNANNTFTNLVNSALKAVRTYNANTANVRKITDGATASNTQLSSPSQANFTAGDIGKYVYGPGIPFGTVLSGPVSGAGTSITMSKSATATASALPITIGQSQILRVRVETGIHSPNWVFALDGAPTNGVAITSNSGNTGFAPKWWRAGCQTAYAQLIQGLSQLPVYTDLTQTTTQTLDQCPEIREVTVGLTMLFFGEVFFRFAGTGSNDANMVNAGLTTTKDQAAMNFMMDTHIASFTNTLTILDCNAYDNYAGAGSTPSGLTFLGQVQDYAAIRPGPVGLEFTNASLGPATNKPLYTQMKLYGPLGNVTTTNPNGGTNPAVNDPLRNNTVALSAQMYPVGQGGVTQSNTAAVLAYAVSWGMTSVELISGATTSLLTPGDANLQSNFRRRTHKLAVERRG